MSKENKNFGTSRVCVGTGLIALDVIISSINNTPTQFLAGGSCGNVQTILSYLGWVTYPIARLSNNVAAELLLEDLKHWNVKDDLLDVSGTGSTPIIIHRILKDQSGTSKHRFEFRNPEDGTYLPSYKPVLAKSVTCIFEKISKSNVFYFDRINRGAIELAKLYKSKSAVIFFEPSTIKDIKAFKECIDLADVIKFSDDRISDYDSIFPVGMAGLEIQTLGMRGLKFRKRGEEKWTFLDGFKIENVIDAAGAGDWCTSGIIATLFQTDKKVEAYNKTEIIYALQFGQALSALNCTFEGARGLMYNIKKHELLLLIQHILSSKVKIIPRSKTYHNYEVKNSGLNISSLFIPV